MTQHSKTGPTNTTETNGDDRTNVVGKWFYHTHPAGTTSPMSLYAGTGPFCWSIDAYVEKRVEPLLEQLVEQLLGQPEPAEKWFITLHVTAQGGDNQRIFKSDTVQVVPNTSTSTRISFPTNTVSPIATSSYGMPTIGARLRDGENFVLDTIGVMFTLDSTGHPVVTIVDTEITSMWMIGAREIVLTDPPLRF